MKGSTIVYSKINSAGLMGRPSAESDHVTSTPKPLFNSKKPINVAKEAKQVKSHKRNVETIYPLMKGSTIEYSESNSAGLMGRPSAKSDHVTSTPKPLFNSKKPAATKEASLHKSSKTSKSLAPIDLNLSEYNPRPTSKNYRDAPARDIDKRDSGDPLLVTVYVQEIYKYYGEQEHRAVVRPYMHLQEAMNPTRRTVLIDWLCEVHHKLKFKPETLYLTVNIVDRYFAKKANVPKKELQLIGTTALLVASKYEEIVHANIDDLVEVCADTYSHSEILEMEETILKMLQYRLSIPTIYNFLVRYLNATQANFKLCYLSSYIAEGSLHSYDMMKKYKPSQLAAAAVLLGRKATGRNIWSPTLFKYSSYREEDVVPVARKMVAKMTKEISSSTKLASLRVKYGSGKLHKVASIALPSDI
jgi:cyclin B